MKTDYLKELGHLGLIARLKRLSDSVLYNIRDIYAEYDLDIEPNWHLVFLYLEEKEMATISDMSHAFHQSQPGLVKVIERMKRRGYVTSANDKQDSRKRQITLTTKAKKQLPLFKEIWAQGEASIKNLLRGNKEFMLQLDNLEKQLAETSFSSRVLKRLNK